MINVKVLTEREWGDVRRKGQIYDPATKTVMVADTDFYYRIIEQEKHVRMEYAHATWTGDDYEIVSHILIFEKESGKKADAPSAAYDDAPWLETIEDYKPEHMSIGILDLPDDVIQNTSPIKYLGKHIKKNNEGDMFVRNNEDSPWMHVTSSMLSLLRYLERDVIDAMLEEDEMVKALTSD